MKNISWACPFCDQIKIGILGSKFVWRREKGVLVKRRKCPECLAKSSVKPAASQAHAEGQAA